MATVAMVGDIFLQQPLPDNSAMAEVIEALKSADFAFGNLETPVTKGGEPIEKWINMRMPPDLLDDVMAMGFHVLTLANNHMMDYGEYGFVDTLTHFVQRDLTYVGAGLTIDLAWEAKIVGKGDFDVAFLGAASTLGPLSAAGPDRPGVAPIHVSESYAVDPHASMEQPGSAPYVHTRAWQEDIERALAAIEAVLYDVDLIVVAMHWGVPPFWRSRFQDGLADYQIEVGHALIDAGADVVVGHHPHSLQQVEVYKGKAIFYSLGNFVFHHNQGPAAETPVSRNAPYGLSLARRDRNWSESLIVVAELDDEGEIAYRLVPVLLDDLGNPALLKGEEAEALIKRLDAMSPQAAISHVDGIGHLSVV
ncbi:MAG: CapA family protein [Chloroflexota bacterium]|nr:CapA family protein [Chloroflexota bacterium]